MWMGERWLEVMSSVRWGQYVEVSTKSFTTPREISSAPVPSSSPVIPHAEAADIMATMDFQSAYHPFVKETNPQGYQFFCRGNFVLAHLNFCFNHLSTEVLKEIQEILLYQKSSGNTEEGLKSISFYGNNMKSEDTEQLEKELGETLMMKTSRTSTVTINSKELLKKYKRASR